MQRSRIPVGRNHAFALAPMLATVLSYGLAVAGVILLLTAPTARGESPASPEPVKTVDSFAEVRSEVLNAIGAATQRIWLTTDYLTDGEIVSALFIAQYRKIDVQVLLGRAKANYYMSRLNYLKNQNIPVYLKPDTPALKAIGKVSSVLCDDRLLQVDGELDFLARLRRYTLTKSTDATAAAYASAFAAAAAQRVPAVARSLPLVGRPGAHPMAPARATPPAFQPPMLRSEGESGPGVYTYKRLKEPRPPGVPEKLPKTLKSMARPKHDLDAPPPAPTEPASAQPSPPYPLLPDAGGTPSVSGDSLTPSVEYLSPAPQSPDSAAAPKNGGG